MTVFRVGSADCLRTLPTLERCRYLLASGTVFKGTFFKTSREESFKGTLYQRLREDTEESFKTIPFFFANLYRE